MSQKTQNNNILQVFCGRLFDANLRDHKNQVFEKMKNLPWELVTPSVYSWVYLLGIFDYRGDIIVSQENGIPLNQNNNRVPSLFAISDHTATHPDLGTTTEFKSLIERIHEAGGKVMVDYVANHTSTNHPWTKIHPEYYKRSGNELHREFSQDVFVLNYDNLDLCEEMAETLNVISSWGVDGLRCDMAHLVPLKFWQMAINRVKDINKDFFMLAEAYSPSVFDWKPLTSLIDVGFDSIYEEFFFRNLKTVLVEKGSWIDLAEHIKYTLNQSNQKFTHYLANHDDPISPRAHQLQEALLTLLMTLGGHLLIPQGQLLGQQSRLAHHSLEILAKNYSEISQIPLWFERVIKAFEVLVPKAYDLVLKDDDLSVIKIHSQIGDGEILINLDVSPHSYENILKHKSNGWLHPEKQILGEGEAEIII